MNTSDLYTAIDVYFFCNEDATMQKWNELSIIEKIQYEELAERYNRESAERYNSQLELTQLVSLN